MSTQPAASRQPKGSSVKRAALAEATTTSSSNRIETRPGSRCAAPHNTSQVAGTMKNSPTTAASGRTRTISAPLGAGPVASASGTAMSAAQAKDTKVRSSPAISGALRATVTESAKIIPDSSPSQSPSEPGSGKPASKPSTTAAPLKPSTMASTRTGPIRWSSRMSANSVAQTGAR